MKALQIVLLTLFCVYAENEIIRTSWMATSTATSHVTNYSTTSSPSNAIITDDDSNYMTDSQFQDHTVYAENQNNRTNLVATTNETSRVTSNSTKASPSTAAIMDDETNPFTDSQFQDDSEMKEQTTATNVFSYDNSNVSSTEVMPAFQMWSSVIAEIQRAIQHPFISILKLLRQLEMPLPTGVSEACRKHVRLFFTDLLDTFIEHKNPMDQWSVQLLDAMAKLPSGVLRGAITWPGSFRQCTDISVASKRDAGAEEQHFVGEHCMVQIEIPGTARLQVASYY